MVECAGLLPRVRRLRVGAGNRDRSVASSRQDPRGPAPPRIPQGSRDRGRAVVLLHHEHLRCRERVAYGPRLRLVPPQPVPAMTEREQVRQFLAKLLRKREGEIEALGDGDSLVLSGRLTSVEVVDTLEFLETTFGFEIDPNEFDQEQFDSVDSIMAMLGAV